ncbi:hypothetical protein [Motilibacter rhizosphaerae]|uniref:hypothetical protein n=1 Tax=Motilibacter rhizosphaerae TaxID=598652 RepID=UPI001E4FD6DF|nr:hypothetical protein [Motilibacter rhizosphaerae]
MSDAIALSDAIGALEAIELSEVIGALEAMLPLEDIELLAGAEPAELPPLLLLPQAERLRARAVTVPARTTEEFLRSSIFFS